MIKEAIKKAVDCKNLTREEAESSMKEIMSGEATPSQIACFITALRMKGETIEEITGCAAQMRAHANTIHPKAKHLVDTCGTGGDISHTLNVSTISALVAAGAGVQIAKHGNRSVSSKCGSADLLEALGVKIDIEPKAVEACINEVGIGFIFAPKFHPAMKHAMPSRREIGIRTIFNILGPLTNPANAQAQILGVFDEKLTKMMAEVLSNLGTKEAMIVHGMDGLDEISIGAETKVSHLKDGKIKTYTIQPGDFGIAKGSKKDIVVGGIEEGKKAALEVLEGKDKGAKRNIVVLNAAAAITVGGKSKDIKQGIELAGKSIDSGAAIKKLHELIKFTNKG